jgi:TonB family protein
MITHAAKLTFPSVAGNVGPGAYYATTVQIDIDSTGKITKTTTILSSGYGDMDDAALKAAAASTYQPKVVNCKAVPSAYLFHAAFSVP